MLNRKGKSFSKKEKLRIIEEAEKPSKSCLNETNAKQQQQQQTRFPTLILF